MTDAVREAYEAAVKAKSVEYMNLLLGLDPDGTDPEEED